MADLSPVSAAVLEAYGTAGLPGALRALAEHRTVAATDGPLDHWLPGARTRRELTVIAAEIEARPAPKPVPAPEPEPTDG